MKFSRILNCIVLIMAVTILTTITFIVDEDTMQYQMMIGMAFIITKITFDIIFDKDNLC